MITLIQDHNHRLNLTIKEHHEVGGQGSWPRGSGAKTSKKGGVRGGSQKSPNFAHGGGKSGGGFLGGVPKNRDHKTGSFMIALNMKFNVIIEDDHHR